MANNEHPGRFNTPLGAYVGIQPLDNYLEELIKGPGCLLYLGMQDHRDGRNAEVVLSRENAVVLREYLTRWLDSTEG